MLSRTGTATAPSAEFESTPTAAASHPSKGGPADRAGLVILCRTGRSCTPRNRGVPMRSCGSPGQFRRPRLETSRRGEVLGIKWRHRAARHAGAGQRPCLHARRHGIVPIPRRPHRRPVLVAQRSDRRRHQAPHLGDHRLTAACRRPRLVSASGALVAYDLMTGDKRWVLKSTGGSYSSPHLVSLDGVPQIR